MLEEGADETSTPARGAGVVTSTNIGYDVQARDIRARLVQRDNFDGLTMSVTYRGHVDARQE
jgi:hypothetical protein